jgi:malic enzyme
MWSVPQIPPIFYESLFWESPYVNNILGYPGIWRGTLDAKAVKINYEMYKTAALAIAGTATPGKLVPSPLDPKVHLEVTHRVARAAMESGVAERQLDDDYFEDTNIKGPFYA